MSVYMTEEEQVEVLKNWWKKHGSKVTTILAVVLLCIAAYRYWNWHNEKIILQASMNYEQMMSAYANRDNKVTRAFANDLTKENQGTVYADAAYLTLAKLDVEEKNYKNAANNLEKVIKSSKSVSLKQIARLRRARILLNAKDYDKALIEINTVDDKAYVSLIDELKGDIYTQRKDYPKALTFYKKALESASESGFGSNPLLEMKTQELASRTHSVKDSTTQKA